MALIQEQFPPEPEVYVTELEYCHSGPFGFGGRCSDCRGHEVEVVSDVWAEWNRLRRLHERQCQALTVAGARCRNNVRRSQVVCRIHNDA